MTPPSLIRVCSTKPCFWPVALVFGVFGAVLLGGCQGPVVVPVKTILCGDSLTVDAVDPAPTPHHGWKSVDEAISRAALELLVIARPAGGEGVYSRVYSLRTLGGKPGELVVTRKEVGLGIEPSAGLKIECRLGRHGEKELERELLEKIQKALIEQQKIERQ